MKLIRAAVVILSLLLCAVSSRAQPSTIQQLQNNQLNTQQQMPLPGLRVGTNAPELYPGENEDIGPQRILRLNPRPNYFEVWLDSEVFYSGNANYAQGTSRLNSFVYVNTVQAAFAPPPTSLGPIKLYPTIGVSSQWYNYDSGSMIPFNFEAQTIFAGGKYLYEKWLATVGANYTRIVDQESQAETYHEFLPSLGVQRFIPITETLLLSIGDQVDYHFTRTPPIYINKSYLQSPYLNDHFDNIIFATLNWQVTKHFAVQPFYRFQYSYYPNNTAGTTCRRDLLNATGITLVYNFNQYFSARAFYNYNNKYSDDPSAGYDEMNGGVGGSFDIKF